MSFTTYCTSLIPRAQLEESHCQVNLPCFQRPGRSDIERYGTVEICRMAFGWRMPCRMMRRWKADAETHNVMAGTTLCWIMKTADCEILDSRNAASQCGESFEYPVRIECQ